MTQIHKAIISEIIKETHNVRTLRLKFSDIDNFSFLPGQFVMLTIDTDPEKQKRSYSIASSSMQKDSIEITFRIEGKFTTKLSQMQKADSITVMGPYGHFTFRDEIKQDLVIIAGGTGIAPFRSYVKYIDEKGLPNRVIVFYSSKMPEDVIYYNEFIELQRRNRNIEFVFTVTRYEGNDWHELKGRFDEQVIKSRVSDMRNKLFYSCGSTSFVNEMVAILKKTGVNDEQIKTEKWG